MLTVPPPSRTAHSLGRRANPSRGTDVRPSSPPQLSSSYLVREAGRCGAATVVGDGGGQVPQRAAHRGVDTVASTLVLITALGLPKRWCPVWRAGGRGLSLAFLLPAG